MAINLSNLSKFGYEEILEKHDSRASVTTESLVSNEAHFFNGFFTAKPLHIVHGKGVGGKHYVVSLIDTSVKTYRTFVVVADKLDSFTNELQKYKGLLRHEFERIFVASDSLKYNHKRDEQAEKVYLMEYRMFIRHSSEVFKLPNREMTTDIIDNHNKSLNKTANDFSYALHIREAKDKIMQVCEDYGMPLIEAQTITKSELENKFGKTDQDTLALCAFQNKSKPFITPMYATHIYFHSYNIIMNYPVYHELAHSITSYEFGTFNHDPAFVLTYMELLSRYLNKDFNHLLNMCKQHGVKFSNPIYSSQFKTLPKEERGFYEREYKTTLNSIHDIQHS